MLVLLLMAAGSGFAQDEAPAAPPELEAAQANADEAFEAERFDEAYEIYRERLAPMGDKYAQYMIGLMHLRGLGVPEDRPLGAAWLELAAERGDASLAAERDAVMARLDPEEREKQRSLFKKLQADFGDCALVSRALAQDRNRLAPTTGTRVASNETPPVRVIYLDETENISQMELRERIRKRQRFLREYCEYR
ncbi:MAG: hypothetical protein ACREVN_02350 [Gammaproteobacteria bacterium]